MFMKKLLVICMLMALMSACRSETLVTKVDPTKPGARADGVLFSLPETLVVAEIPVSRVSSSPGMFPEWTGFFYPELSSDEYVTEEGSRFKLGPPTFNTRGQTDPDNIYMAHIKTKLFETKTLLLEFNDDGIIARTEATSKDDSIDIITSGLKAAATIAAPLLPFGPGASAVQPADLKRSQSIDEQYFRSKLDKRALALYDSLDQTTRQRLADNFGYQFLLYVVQATSTAGNDAAGIEFFFTLNEDQWQIVEAMDHTGAPCPVLPPDPAAVAAAAAAVPAAPAPVAPAPAAPAPAPIVSNNCLPPATLVELARALKAYNKIQELKLKRQDYLNEPAPPQTATSTLLEFRLKQLDDQIDALEKAYFFGTSSETSSTSRFEFKPTGANLNQNLFTYSAGGPSPGICGVNAEAPGVFKARWPKNLGGDCHAASPNFEAGDVRDLRSLATKLAAGAAAGADPVSTYLYGRLPNAAGLLNMVGTPQQRDQLIQALITDLNTIVNGASIYTVPRFQNVRLSAATIKLLNTPGPPANLNRLLIEDAYRSEIFRTSAWAPLQVILKVDPAPPGFAQAVQNANLSQPGKRGFPYRVPAFTIARLFDNNVERGRSDVRIAQFGPVQTLPASLGGRRSSYKITYYDESGAIKLFDMSADALIQQSNINDITDAATTLRDAETTRLKRETEILKARKDKLDAEKALREAQEAAEPSPSPTPSPQ